MIVEGGETPEEWRDVQNRPHSPHKAGFTPGAVETLNTAVRRLSSCPHFPPGWTIFRTAQEDYEEAKMSKARKITAAISGAFLLLIVGDHFDCNLTESTKPTINQKVSELNRRSLSVAIWARCGSGKTRTGWRSWVQFPCTRGRHHPGNPPDISVTNGAFAGVEATLARWRC